MTPEELRRAVTEGVARASVQRPPHAPWAKIAGLVVAVSIALAGLIVWGFMTRAEAQKEHAEIRGAVKMQTARSELEIKALRREAHAQGEKIDAIYYNVLELGGRRRGKMRTIEDD